MAAKPVVLRIAGRRHCGRLETLPVMALAVVATHGHGQNFYYVEPGVAACPAAPAAPAAPAVNAAATAAKSVARGVALPGRIRVTCGFDQGSYTVALNSTDPAASFAPKTFLVNFGRIAGNGVYAVTFSTLGVQSLSTSITSNMGSPPVRGHFLSPVDTFTVVMP